MKSKKKQSTKATLQDIWDIEAEWCFYQVPEDERQACLEWEFWREAHSLDDNVKKVVARLREGRPENQEIDFFEPRELLSPLASLACYSEGVWPQKPFLKEDRSVRLKAWSSQIQLSEERESPKKNRTRERWEQMNDFQQSLHWFCPPYFLHKSCPCNDFIGEQCECRFFLSEWRKLPSGKTIVAGDFFDEERKFGCVTAAVRIDLVRRDKAIVEDFKQWLKQLRNEVEPLAGFHTGPSEIGKAEKVDRRMRLLKGLGAIRLQNEIGSFDRIFKVFSLSDRSRNHYEGGGLPASNHKSWRGLVRGAKEYLDKLVSEFQQDPKS